LASDVDVTDGDGLRLEGERIWLWGIDAPELGQPCERAV
jgi:endonuclease YncB( thermonuclease family)